MHRAAFLVRGGFSNVIVGWDDLWAHPTMHATDDLADWFWRIGTYPNAFDCEAGGDVLWLMDENIRFTVRPRFVFREELLRGGPCQFLVVDMWLKLYSERDAVLFKLFRR